MLFPVILQEPRVVNIIFSIFIAQREVICLKSFSQGHELSFERRSVGLQSTCFPHAPAGGNPSAVVHGHMSMSDHLGELSTHRNRLTLSVSGYSVKSVCAFTHLRAGQGQRRTLSCQQLLQSFTRNILEFPGPQGREIRDCQAHEYREWTCTLEVFWPNSLVFKKTKVITESDHLFCSTFSFLVCRESLCPAWMKCDFETYSDSCCG